MANPVKSTHLMKVLSPVSYGNVRRNKDGKESVINTSVRGAMKHSRRGSNEGIVCLNFDRFLIRIMHVRGLSMRREEELLIGRKEAGWLPNGVKHFIGLDYRSV